MDQDNIEQVPVEGEQVEQPVQEQIEQPVEIQQEELVTENIVPQQQHESTEGSREHRIGLLSQRIKSLEDEHVFTKERKAELSNLRKKLRIDKNNQARYE